MDDFAGAPEMPKANAHLGITAPRRAELPPIELVHDAKRDEWTMILNDGMGERVSAILPREVVRQLAEALTEPQRLQEDNGLQFQVTVVEYEMMGAEGAAFIRRPVRHDPTESIQALAMRAFHLGEPYRQHHPGTRLEVQVIPESIPKVETATGVWPL